MVVENLSALAIAYVGPGPGLSMLGALFSLLLTLGIAFWAVALWPLKAFLRKRREGRQGSTIEATTR